MRKLSAFMFVTLNGYFEGSGRDISWHVHGREENAFAARSLKAGNTLLFGRVTYEMMASYWPTPIAHKNDPSVAKGMNKAHKIVFSRTLRNADWENTIVVNGDIVEVVRKMKKQRGKNLTLLGSGSILSQFAESGLIDEYQIMIDPVAMVSGTPLFTSIKQKLNMKLVRTGEFKSGVVLLVYKPA
jgi:dihydrofolate reductase